MTHWGYHNSATNQNLPSFPRPFFVSDFDWFRPSTGQTSPETHEWKTFVIQSMLWNTGSHGHPTNSGFNSLKANWSSLSLHKKIWHSFELNNSLPPSICSMSPKKVFEKDLISRLKQCCINFWKFEIGTHLWHCNGICHRACCPIFAYNWVATELLTRLPNIFIQKVFQLLKLEANLWISWSEVLQPSGT